VKAAYGYTAAGLIVAATACIWYAMGGPGATFLHRAVTRARWAWACRKPPARTEGNLSHADHLTFTRIVETWRQPDAPQRTPT
jgi:hypothetical protein